MFEPIAITHAFLLKMPCFSPGIWTLLAGRVLSFTCTMGWHCLSDGWYDPTSLVYVYTAAFVSDPFSYVISYSSHACLLAGCSDHIVRVFLRSFVLSLRSGN